MLQWRIGDAMKHETPVTGILGSSGTVRFMLGEE